VLCQRGLSGEVFQAEKTWIVGKRVVERQAGGGRVFRAADVVLCILHVRRDSQAISHHALPAPSTTLIH
jgi:hypothetical protein